MNKRTFCSIALQTISTQFVHIFVCSVHLLLVALLSFHFDNIPESIFYAHSFWLWLSYLAVCQQFRIFGVSVAIDNFSKSFKYTPFFWIRLSNMHSVCCIQQRLQFRIFGVSVAIDNFSKSFKYTPFFLIRLSNLHSVCCSLTSNVAKISRITCWCFNCYSCIHILIIGDSYLRTCELFGCLTHTRFGDFLEVSLE